VFEVTATLLGGGIPLRQVFDTAEFSEAEARHAFLK
jgi:hypothetical protein